jgi:predicted esterase
MSRAAVRCLVPAFVCLALVGSPHFSLGQGASEPEKVKIQTVDGADLRGFFYQSPKKNAPTILVLHNLGAHSQVKGWKDLATFLQPNYSVMLFDFRGHGESKEVDPTIFWNYKPNVAGAGKTSVGKSTIDFKNFDKTGGYYPILINDIAAVKGYLDRRSDTGGCNTSSFILIGDGKGAALGSIWLNSECYRHKVSLGPMGVAIEARPEGKDVIAAIFLSISNKLGMRKLALSSILEEPGRKNGTPMVFMYGDADETGAATAKALEKALKPTTTKTVAPNMKYTGAAALGKTKLTGVELLEQKSLKVDTAIQKYLENVVSDKGNEWSDHDYRRSQFVWRMGVVGQTLVAKRPMEMNPEFDDYGKFIR